MSKQLAKMISGSQLVINLRNVRNDAGITQDKMTLAYITNLSFQSNMATTGVQVIGAFANQAIEPLSYTASGSFSVINYVNPGQDTDTANADLQVRTASKDVQKIVKAPGSSNSMLSRTHFMPRQMLLSETFDIDVCIKDGANLDVASYIQSLKTSNPALTDAQVADSVQKLKQARAGSSIYTIYDCRFTDWAIAFSVGQLASERVSFICRGYRFNMLDSDSQKIEDLKGSQYNFSNPS